ncbi:MAG: BrnA antitoxin family protein [Steroidobacteraceae bacterium]
MRKRKPLTDKDGEVRELTAEDFAEFMTFSELPKSLQATLRAIGKRGPQKAPTKQLVSLRLSPEVLAHYRATGPGWQTRIDQALKRVVARAR